MSSKQVACNSTSLGIKLGVDSDSSDQELCNVLVVGLVDERGSVRYSDGALTENISKKMCLSDFTLKRDISNLNSSVAKIIKALC